MTTSSLVALVVLAGLSLSSCVKDDISSDSQAKTEENPAVGDDSAGGNIDTDKETRMTTTWPIPLLTVP